MSAFKKTRSILYLLEIFRFFDPIKNYFHFLNCFCLQLGTQDALWVWGLGQEINDHWSGWWKKAAGGGNKTPTTHNYNNCFFGSSYPKMYILSTGVPWRNGWVHMIFVFPPKSSKGRVFNPGACFHIQSKCTFRKHGPINKREELRVPGRYNIDAWNLWVCLSYFLC